MQSSHLLNKDLRSVTQTTLLSFQVVWKACKYILWLFTLSSTDLLETDDDNVLVFLLNFDHAVL